MGAVLRPSLYTRPRQPCKFPVFTGRGAAMPSATRPADRAIEHLLEVCAAFVAFRDAGGVTAQAARRLNSVSLASFLREYC